MSYANGTTHYNLPQTVGTDKRDWFDTNQAFSDIDAAIYGAVQSASQSASAITALTTRVGTNETNIADLQTSRTTDEAKISALETLTAQHTTDIAGVKADALDMICAVDEGTAQVASVKVDEGEYFRYNDVLYIATDDIAVGDTIVPNTNCRATNVGTELEEVATKLNEITIYSSTTERVIGIDYAGNNVYQKTLVGTVSTYVDSGSRRNFEVDLPSDVASVKFYKGTYTETNGTRCIIGSSATTDLLMQTCSNASIFTSTGTKKIYITVPTSITSLAYEITIEYTK